MNKKEAQAALLEGKKIANQYFTPEEYIVLDNGILVEENGYEMPVNFIEDTADTVIWREWNPSKS
jgi:hypothetical protein